MDSIGALIAGAPRERAETLRERGRQDGLAFQAADDLLGEIFGRFCLGK